MNIKKQMSRFALLFTIAATLFSCSEDDKKEVTRLDAITVKVAADPNFSILNAALKKTGLDITLGGPGSYTIFAPTNAAFTASLPTLTEASINALTTAANPVEIANLRVILLNHVIGVGTRANDLLAARYLKTFAFFRANAPLPAVPATPTITSNATAQMSLFVNQIGTDVLLNGGAANGGAKVTEANIDVANGVIHIIDRVLTLPTIENHLNANPDFASFMAIVNSPDQAVIKTSITTATNLAARTLIVPNAAALIAANAAATTTVPVGFLVGVSPANVTRVLQYHQLSGNRVRTFFVDNFTFFSGLSGQNFTSFTTGTLGFRLEDRAIAPRNKVSKFVFNDIQGVNGVIHIVDKVLEPIL
jgi:uncharacterized surface protein with fasciclin (FAS1) repeats